MILLALTSEQINGLFLSGGITLIASASVLAALLRNRAGLVQPPERHQGEESTSASNSTPSEMPVEARRPATPRATDERQASMALYPTSRREVLGLPAAGRHI